MSEVEHSSGWMGGFDHLLLIKERSKKKKPTETIESRTDISWYCHHGGSRSFRTWIYWEINWMGFIAFFFFLRVLYWLCSVLACQMRNFGNFGSEWWSELFSICCMCFNVYCGLTYFFRLSLSYIINSSIGLCSLSLILKKKPGFISVSRLGFDFIQEHKKLLFEKYPILIPFVNKRNVWCWWLSGFT